MLFSNRLLGPGGASKRAGKNPAIQQRVFSSAPGCVQHEIGTVLAGPPPRSIDQFAHLRLARGGLAGGFVRRLPPAARLACASFFHR